MSMFIKDIGDVLTEFGNELQEDLINSLKNKKSSIFTSSKLQQSIIFKVDKEEDGSWTFVLTMEDYGKYIDEGVQGKGGKRKTTSKFSGEQAGSMFINKAPGSRFSYKDRKPPITNELRNWASQAGMNVFALQNSLFQQGVKPNRFYSDIVNEDLAEDLTKRLEEVGAKAIEIDITEGFRGTANG